MAEGCVQCEKMWRQVRQTSGGGMVQAVQREEQRNVKVKASVQCCRSGLGGTKSKPEAEAYARSV